MPVRTYSDDQLAVAVAGAHSWRGVLRHLGLRATSAGSLRSARRRAESLGLRHDHFTGQRTWSDRDLTQAVAASSSWSNAAMLLDLAPSGGVLTSLRAHSLRLGLDTDHIDHRPSNSQPPLVGVEYRPQYLRRSGTLFAAAWFALRGAVIAWPLEPCRYDLLVDLAGAVQRIQVKTTEGSGSKAMLHVSNSRRVGRQIYAPGEIDSFFAIDAELTAYLIPYAHVAGFTQIQLGRYTDFVVAARGQLIPSACASPGP